ncbi:hypothetical protein MRX96_031138 [Rhipicephalus microplus]
MPDICSGTNLHNSIRNFVDSEWCRWEFRLDYQRAMEDHVNQLVIELIDGVVPDAVDERLRAHVQATSYVRWGESNFWDELLYSLPKRNAERKLVVDRPQYPMSP